MAKRKKNNAGKMSIADMRQLINKSAGMNVAHNLEEANPTLVHSIERQMKQIANHATIHNYLYASYLYKIIPQVIEVLMNQVRFFLE